VDLHQLSHVTSYGEVPVVIYQPSPCGTQHGNFISASYRALLRRPQWKQRFEKVHSPAGRAFPKSDCVSKELDSSMSSDALLMNIFCYPGMTKRRELSLMLGTESGDLPEFGFKPRIPLTSGFVERTEIDMKLGTVLFEAKLTESDFQTQKAAIVERYRDLKEGFECRKLPRIGREYVSYQLLRNVLAAYALNLSFCVLLDGRRPDLVEQWYAVMRCVRPMDLRTRCKILTWQELSAALPGRLQNFLELKYGIVS
jgi:restriction endonuclease-like protein